MQDEFQIDGIVFTMQDSVPVRFAHRKGQDKPENHILHINNYVEIYIFISGDHRYIVENSLYTLRKGDIIIINPQEVHKALPMSSCMYERFFLLVDCHTFDGMYLNPLYGILNSLAGKGNLISPNGKNRDEILKLLYAMSDHFREGRDDKFRVFSFLMRFLDEINQCLKQNCLDLGTATHIPALLEMVLTYVAENAASIQSVSEMASDLGMTPQYLSAYFSKHIGTPLKIYIQAKKIALAKDLLDKGADVTKACYDCGFNDCSYFIRVFKKYTGITPLRYRQLLMGVEKRSPDKK